MSKNHVKKVLFNTFGDFADKRFKILENEAPFQIDDRGRKDLDARGKLFLWFCQILATVKDADTIEVLIQGGLPMSPNVKAWLRHMSAHEGPQSQWWKFDIARGEQKTLSDFPSVSRR